MEFYSGAATTPFATDTTSPYSATWNTSALSICSPQTLSVKAYDTKENASTSATVNVTIAGQSTPGDGHVTWTQPAQCGVISGTSISLAVTANLSRHTYTYKYYLDGSSTPFTTKSCSETGCTSVWNSTTVADGAHTLKVIAVDSKGITKGISSVLTVVVNNAATFSLISDFSTTESGNSSGIGCNQDETYAIPFQVKNIGGASGSIAPTGAIANCGRDRATDPWKCSSPVGATITPVSTIINAGQTASFTYTTGPGSVRGGDYYRYSISVPGYTATSAVSKNGCQW